MRWPWKPRTPDLRELEQAQQALAKAQRDEPRVARIAEAHHRKIAENHFAQKFKKAMEA
jgi:hypothetical protein